MNSAPIRKAVIPVAGRGKRFFPATKVVPKALLPIAGKPLIQHAVEEAIASGLETVILVLAPTMTMVSEHFTINDSDRDGRQLRQLVESIEIRTVLQNDPKGLADAIACTEPEINNEPFAVILPDVLIDSALPATSQLMRGYKAHPGCMIATQMISRLDVEKFGIVVPASGHSNHELTFRVASLLEKPKQSATASRYAVIGRYILPPEIFGYIRGLKPGYNNELQLTDAISACAASSATFACLLDGDHYDAGSKLGYIQASVAYALKDPDVERPLRRHLAQLSTSALGTIRAS